MKLKYYLLAGVLSLGIFIYYNNVSKTISSDDIFYCNKLTNLDLEKLNVDKMSIDSQIKIIHKIQCDIINYSIHEQIPFKQAREPKNYYNLKKGYCFDRARVIEKALNIAGLKTRHIAIFINGDRSETTILDLRKKTMHSHAITEVKTKAGWMYVGSNKCFISADTKNKIYPIEDLRKVKIANIDWKYKDEVIDNTFINSNSIIIFGLYSRNGLMYSPYIAVPEINVSEFLTNFIHKY